MPVLQSYVGASGLKMTYLNHCRALNISPNSKVLQQIAERNVDSLEDIDLTQNFLGRNGFRAFLEVIQHCPKLKNLVLRDNGLDNDAIVALCRIAARHPSLAEIDLSGNPLSLAAGQAALDLSQRNRNIINVDLGNTHVEERIVAKVTKQTQANERLQMARLKGRDAATPFQQVQLEYAEKRKGKHKPRKAVSPMRTQTDLTAGIPMVLKKDYAVRIPKRGKDGWVVLNVYVACSRSDFLSELAALHNRVIPALNQALRPRKVFLHPYAMYHEPEEGRQRYTVHDDKVLPSVDPDFHFRFIDRCKPLYLALLGDKVGWTPVELPTDRMFDHLRKGTQGPMNVLEAVYGALHDVSAAVGLFVLREPAQHIGTPEGILEVVSGDFNYCHPDPDGTVVVSGPDAGRLRRDDRNGDPQLQTKRWEVYDAMKDSIRRTIHPSLVVDGYGARYGGVDQFGAVTMTGLETLEKRLYDLLWGVVDHMYPDEGLTAWYHQPSIKKGTNFCPTALHQYLARQPPLVGRKRAVAYMESYIVSPPSRNMLLLVGSPGIGSSAIIAEGIKKTQARKNYITISHFLQHNGLCSEGASLRTLLLSLCKQMLPEEAALPPSILDTINLQVIKEYWLGLLKTVKHSKTLAIFIDNLDLVQKHPKVPPRISKEMGAVDPSEHDEAALLWPLYDWIPVALPKNVRLVATMYEDSRAQIDELVVRGVDGCSAYPLCPLEPKDAELYVQHKLGAGGVQLSEDDMKLMQYKKHHLYPQYLSVASELLLQRQSKVNYLQETTFLEVLPMTLVGLCEAQLELAEKTVRPELVRWFCGLIVCSRDGLLELELRELLIDDDRRHPKASQLAEGLLDAHKCNLQEWGLLLQCLQVFLQPFLNGPMTILGAKQDLPEDPEGCMNGANCILGFRNSTFAAVARGRYMRSPDQAMDFHMALARYYERKANLPDHPLRIKGLKNFPYHLLKAQSWQPFMQFVVTLPHVEKAFTEQVGFQLYQDLHLALAGMHAYYINLGFDARKKAVYEAWMERLREYLEFLTNSCNILSFRPALTYQEALATTEATSTYVEASEYFKEKCPDQPHFTWVNRTRSRLHDQAVVAAQFSPNGMRIMTGSEDKVVKICNLVADPIHRPTHNAEVAFCKYSITSRYILVVTRDRAITVYDANTGGSLGRCEGHPGPIICADISCRGRYIASGGEDQQMRVWETETQRCFVIMSHSQYCTSGSPHRAVYQVKCHPTQEEIVMSACDKTVLVWQLLPQTSTSTPETSARCVRTCVAHTQYPVFFIAWSPLNSYILTAVRVSHKESEGLERMPSEDSVLKIWSFVTGRVVARLTGPPSQVPVNNIAVSPCGSMIAMCSPKKICAIWSVDWFNTQEPEVGMPDSDGNWDQKAIEPFTVFNTDGVPQFCTFSDNATHFAAACERLIQVWSIPSRTPVLEFMTRQPITSFDWTMHPSADSGQIIVGDQSGRVYLLKGNNIENVTYADEDTGI
mmetsp:Transcript_133876/g.232298  ORF Transcript_133876/g.232298 Transcript_133876/m.232298 type:complete len:1482 (-) Transcript_133876:497-4942(-)